MDKLSVRPSDINKMFGIPTQTLNNWAKSDGWRKKHYEDLCKIYLERVLGTF